MSEPSHPDKMPGRDPQEKAPIASIQAQRKCFGLMWWDLGVIALVLFALIFWILSGWPEAAQAVSLREQSGRNARLQEFIRSGLWWGMVAALLLGLLLCLARPLWTKPLHQGALPLTFTPGRGFWILMAVIVVAAGWLRWERLGSSLYADEIYTLQNYVSGVVDIRKGSEAPFEEKGWQHTLFGNKEGNNHILYSIAGRASLELWRGISGASREDFNEVALRFPSWVAALLTLGLIGWLLACAGVPRLGILAALLLALHPWHIRYSGEARGYAFAMLFLVMAAGAAGFAVRSGAWRWWAIYAVGQLGLLLSFPGGIYAGAALGVCVVVLLLFHPEAPQPRGLSVVRFGAANIMAAIPFAILFGPSVEQLARYLALDRAKGGLTADWLLDEWALFSVGMPWRAEDPENPLLVGVLDHAAGIGAWWMVAFVGFVMPLLLFLGVVRCWSCGMGARLVAGVSLAGILLAIAHSLVAKTLLFPWYLIFALPGVVLLFAGGIDWIAKLVPPVRGTEVFGRLIIGALIIAFVLVTARPRAIAMRYSREQNREVAEALRDGAGPDMSRETEILAAIVWSNSPAYDGGILWAPHPEQLVPLMRRALSEARPLRYAYAHRERALESVPRTIRMVDDPELFTFLKAFPGTDQAQFTHYLFEMREGLTEDVLNRRLRELGIDLAEENKQ